MPPSGSLSARPRGKWPDERVSVEVEGRTLSITHLSKVLYPETGFTKAEVISYYQRIAPVMLPHLAGRPVTFTRYPHGTGDMAFFAKNCPPGKPDWLPTVRVVGHGSGNPVEYPLIEELPSLIWAVNLAALELHVPLHTLADPGHPTAAVFDLDPGEPAGIVECAQVALLIRDVLAAAKLVCFARTSGGKGMQLYLPLDGVTNYDAARSFAHAVALLLARSHPALVVAGMSKELRRGKVLIDWNQDHPAKTMIAPYSLRGSLDHAVSTPVTWDEVAAMASPGSGAQMRFLAGDVLARVERDGDLMAPMLALRQGLPG